MQEHKLRDSMTQKWYTAEILLIVEAQMWEAEVRSEHFIFQKNNNDSHETQSQKNIAHLKKNQINLNFIDD